MPRRLARLLPARNQAPRRAVTVVVNALAVLIVFCSLVQMYERFGGSPPVVAQVVDRLIEPLHIVSTYGLFAVMTTKRNEIVVEGSYDGAEWRDYEFWYKPGDVARPPRWNIPHQPRLDWQMWFAALDDPRRLRWFSRFLERLLENEPTVTALLERNPSDLCARTVLRLHLCRQRGKGEGPMVGPAIAGTVLPRGASERRMILLSAHDRCIPVHSTRYGQRTEVRR